MQVFDQDQTVNGKNYEKDDRVFIDTEVSNVDVCFLYTLYLIVNLTFFWTTVFKKPMAIDISRSTKDSSSLFADGASCFK